MASLQDVSVRAGARFPTPAQAYAAPPFDGQMPYHSPDAQQGLTVRVLHTMEERKSIAHLRELADFKSEYQLDPGLAAFEGIKDEISVVMALCLEDHAIATIRFVPSGHGVTLTERFWRDDVTNPDILGPTSWEVGRLVMAPENRRSDLLPQCLALAGLELLQHRDVEHLHASCLMSMTRLYRRFGYRIHASRTYGDKDVALIHGTVDQVCARLRLVNSDAAPIAHFQQPNAAHLPQAAHLLQ